MINSGIYEIKNQITGKVYVGSSINISARKKQHLNMLNKGIHHSVRLQNAWTKYGDSPFIFNILENVPDKQRLIEREQYWINHLNAYGENGYNSRPIANSQLGVKASADTKRKISEAYAKRKALPGYVSPNKGRKLTPEACAKIGDSHRGTHHTNESKKKISEARTGIIPKWADPKQRAINLSKARMGYVMPESTKKKLSAINKGKSKYSISKKEEMLELYYKGMTRQEIAKITGADRHLVSDIIAALDPVAGKTSRKHRTKARERMAYARRRRIDIGRIESKRIISKGGER